MAAGTMAGAVDLQFSSSASLDIFELDFVSDDRQLILAGTVPSSERFNRISWGKGPANSEEFPLGLIAGGLVDGNIGLWNPNNLICSDTKKGSETSESALVGQLSKHRGPVRGLEFNVLSPNLLGSGADEGEIYIWDVTKPSEPSHFPPLKGNVSATQGEISFLSWNSKVQHILASTSFNGTTVVWDLKKQKPVISFSDSIKSRCSVLQWNPDVATQLVVASDEDSSPSLKLWDMRNVMSPVKEFVGHTKGVIAMSWCPIDSSYLLTCAKDNRTICWDTVSGEIVAELPAGTNWNFDVHWYSKIPGVISASSFDGKIGIYNIEVSLIINEPVSCEKKSQESESEAEKETWGFMKVMFADDGSARSKLLSHLGFNVSAEQNDTALNNISEKINDLAHDETTNEELSGNKEPTIFADNGEDFFNNLPSPKADTPLSTSGNEFITGDSVPGVKESEPELDGQEESSEPSFDDAVQRALVVGDYKGAVAQCITANRMADALVIAHVGGVPLWERTRDQYLKTSRSPYLKVVSAMVNNDLMSLVNTRPLKSWKETLALLCTFAQQEEWTLLCDTLASRLMTAGNTLAATLCYICAGNIDRTVEIWSKSLSTEPDGKSYLDLLQDLMEKTIVFALAIGQKRFSASLCKLVEKYAEILASQGLLTTAMEYLKLLGTEELSPELAILRDRITLSTESDKEVEKPVTYENSHSQTGLAYDTVDQLSYGVADTSQHYYQETTPSPMQPSVPNSQYGENYQQSFASSIGRGYSAPFPYQPSPQNIQQPNIFVPTQTPEVPTGNFPPPPAAAQPALKPFVPTNLPPLRNFEQYQQPTTLGSQLYPGGVNRSYQAGPPGGAAYGANTAQAVPTPGQKMPQVAAPPSSRGFMSVTNSGVQGLGMNPVKPPSPTQSVPVQPPVAPAAPPPTVQTVDTSNVPAQQKPVIATLTRLFNETSEALGGSRANPAKKREIEDNSKKLGALFAKLNSGDISKNAAERLVQLCQALDNGDFSTALQIQVLLTTSDWDECNFWLATLKRMIKTRQNLR
ncbi:protein transport protein SEC31 homolog B-like [Olea europaea var. sylvestris]|uniref:protein transport protein SEC31 homolog B-like n=1 Tax=Olea europaea var. sylvestris TaxID=158386 RepID=UPI000C1D3797|nr:protein transport protein SEC31 homolog B-like [Olea europaea var. sylvestris]